MCARCSQPINRANGHLNVVQFARSLHNVSRSLGFSRDRPNSIARVDTIKTNEFIFDTWSESAGRVRKYSLPTHIMQKYTHGRVWRAARGWCWICANMCVSRPTKSACRRSGWNVCVLFASVKWRVELAPMVTSTAHDGHCVKQHTSKRYVMAIGLKSSQRVRVQWW